MDVPETSISPPASTSIQPPSVREPVPCEPRTVRCGEVFLWVTFPLTLLLEAFFSIAVAVHYFISEQYVLFGLTAACLVIPTIIVTCVSLIWYYDMDKYYRSLQDAHPDDQDLKGYKKFLTFWSVLCHIIPCGQEFRYCQLLYLTINTKKVVKLSSLWKDAALLRFLHGFLMSAPQITVQLYVLLGHLVIVADQEKMMATEEPNLSPLTCSCLVASGLSLLVTILNYTTSDRLHSDNRRVVFMGHVTCLFWHLCMTVARVSALAVFAVGFGPYVSAVVGIHWIASVFWMAYEKTNFCGDITVRPKKRRNCLEGLFIMIISFVYLFIFFNVQNGSTLCRIVVYHLLTCVETLIIVALYYAFSPSSVLSPWLFSWSIGLYLLGVFFMGMFFGVWHPNRTNKCFRVGIPRRCCSCFCCGCTSKDKPSELPDGIGNVDLPLNVTSDPSSASYDLAQAAASAGVGHLTVLGSPGINLGYATQGPASNVSVMLPSRVITSTPDSSVTRSATIVPNVLTKVPSPAVVARRDSTFSPDSLHFCQTEWREYGEQYTRPVSRLSDVNMFETRGAQGQPVVTPSSVSGANSPEVRTMRNHLDLPPSSVCRSQSDRIPRLYRTRDQPRSQYTNGASSKRNSLAVASGGQSRTDPLSRRSMWHTSDEMTVPTSLKRSSGSYMRARTVTGARGLNNFVPVSLANTKRSSSYKGELSVDMAHLGQLFGGDPLSRTGCYPPVRVSVTDVDQSCLHVTRDIPVLVPLCRTASGGEYDHIPLRVGDRVGHQHQCWGDNSCYHPQGYASTYTSPAHLVAKRSRQRSLSPQDHRGTRDSRRSSLRSRSRSATPGQSPFLSRRKSRHSSLYSHDALQDFTRLYTSPYVSSFRKPDEQVTDTRQDSDGPQHSPQHSSGSQSISDSVFIRSGEGSSETSNTTNSTIMASGAVVHIANSTRNTSCTLTTEKKVDRTQCNQFTLLPSISYPSSGTLV